MRLLWNDQAVDLGGQELRQALARLGVGRGHRIAALAGNTPLHVMLQDAARAGGWTLVPLSPDDPGDVLRRNADDAGCGALVCVESLQGAAEGVLPTGPMLVCNPLGIPVRTRAGTVAPPPPGEPAAFILRTSGTTGTPHPVAVTRAMLDAHARAASTRLHDSADSVWLGVLGLHRVGGVALAERVRRNGGTLVLHERFDAAAVAKALRRHSVTHVSLVPTMLHRLLRAWGEAPPPPALRCVLLGGDRAPEEMVQQALAQGWPVWCTYGMTETCSQVATATPEERRLRPGASGKPLDGVKVEIRDGEIVVSGSTVAGGGPLATGDLGHLDADGFLFVTGRKGDRITTGGAKVDPAVVEDALRQHPAVAEACVVGVPDAEWGERVVAAVVLRAGAALPDLQAWCKPRLAPAEVPKSFHALQTLPRTEVGKVRRTAVRELVQAAVPT